jgi:hypothetical protein
LVSVLFLVVFDPWYLRYVLFFPALFAVVSAKLLGEIPEAVPIAWTALLLQFAGTCVPGHFPGGGLSDMAGQSWRERTLYLHRDFRNIEALGFLEHPWDEVKVYPLYRPDFSRRILPIRARTPAELVEVLRREGIRHLYCQKGHELLTRCLEEDRLTRLGGGLYALK